MDSQPVESNPYDKEQPPNQEFNYFTFSQGITKAVVDMIPTQSDGGRKLIIAFANFLINYPLLRIPRFNDQSGVEYSPLTAKDLVRQHVETVIDLLKSMDTKERQVFNLINESVSKKIRSVIKRRTEDLDRIIAENGFTAVDLVSTEVQEDVINKYNSNLKETVQLQSMFSEEPKLDIDDQFVQDMIEIPIANIDSANIIQKEIASL